MTPYEAYDICCKKNKRIKEYEPIILASSNNSYRYAKDLIQARWPEAEPIILTSSYYSYSYARNIIKQRWIEAEPKIKQNEFYWEHYCHHFNIKKDKVNWKVGL